MRRRALLGNKLGGSSSWDLRNATFNQKTLLVPTGSLRKSGIFIKPDGSRILCSADSSEFSQMDFGTDWDISTLLPGTLISPYVGNNQGITMNADGSILYTVRTTPSLLVIKNVLTVPYDITTRLAGTSSAAPANVRGLAISPDGTKLYLNTTTAIHEYDLTVPYEINAKTLVNTLDLSVWNSDYGDMAISPDGKYIYALRSGQIRQFIMSTAFDLSTAVFDYLFSQGTNIGSAMGLFMSVDGTRFYVSCNNPSQKFAQYDWQ